MQTVIMDLSKKNDGDGETTTTTRTGRHGREFRTTWVDGKLCTVCGGENCVRRRSGWLVYPFDLVRKILSLSHTFSFTLIQVENILMEIREKLNFIKFPYLEMCICFE